MVAVSFFSHPVSSLTPFEFDLNFISNFITFPFVCYTFILVEQFCFNYSVLQNSKCYELNICVFQNPYVEDYILNLMIIEMMTLGSNEVLRMGPHEWELCPYKKTHKDMIIFFLCCVRI